MADVALDKLHRQDVVLDLERDVPVGRGRAVVQSGVYTRSTAGTTVHPRSGTESTERNAVPEKVFADADSLFEIDGTLAAHQ